MKKIKYAHRGLHNKDIKENTLLSFKRAKEKGFGIELDIRITKDDILVALHDQKINGKNIEEINYKEIKHLDIPKIEEIFKLINNSNTEILLEIKESNKKDILRTKLMKELKLVNMNFSIISFDPREVRWFKKNGCKVGQSIDNNNLPSYLKNIFIKAIIKTSNPNFIVVEKSILKEKSIINYRKKKKVISWTIKSKKEEIEAIKYSDNIIFDEYQENKV